MSDATTFGPVEIAVIAFPGNRFTGEVAPAIADLVSSGTVSIIDLVFVTKDADGNVTGVELSDLDDDVAAPYVEIEGEVQGILSDEDFEQIGDLLEPESSALAIVWENAWARRFVERRAGGRRCARRPRSHRRPTVANALDGARRGRGLTAPPRSDRRDRLVPRRRRAAQQGRHEDAERQGRPSS